MTAENSTGRTRPAGFTARAITRPITTRRTTRFRSAREAQEIILPRLLKADENGKLFPMRRTTLWTLVHRGCTEAFPHPMLSAIPSRN